MTTATMSSTRQVCDATGLTFRILDYWDRTGVLPAEVPAVGSGSRRMYSAESIDVARVLGVLAAHGALGDTLRPAEAGIRQVLAEDGLTGVIYIGLGGQVSRMVLTAGWAIDLAAIPVEP